MITLSTKIAGHVEALRVRRIALAKHQQIRGQRAPREGLGHGLAIQLLPFALRSARLPVSLEHGQGLGAMVGVDFRGLGYGRHTTCQRQQRQIARRDGEERGQRRLVRTGQLVRKTQPGLGARRSVEVDKDGPQVVHGITALRPRRLASVPRSEPGRGL